VNVQRKAPCRSLVIALTTVIAGCGSSHLPDDAAADGGSWVDATTVDATAADAGLDGAQRDGGDGGEGLRPTFIEFCTRLRELVCEGVRCCTIADRVITRGCGPAGIRARCEYLGDDPALQDGSLVWDADAAARTIEALESALPTCGAVDRHFNFGVVLHGTLGEGEDCTPSDSEDSLGRNRCRAGLRCAITGTVSDYTGRCAPPGALGDSCNYDCGDGLFCEHTTDFVPWAGYCEPQDDGGECYSDYACSEMFCGVSGCETPSPADTWCSTAG